MKATSPFDIERERKRNPKLMEQNVGVLAFPFTSHPQTLLRFVRRLASAAPQVNFSFFSTASSNAVLFSTGSGAQNVSRNVKPYDVDVDEGEGAGGGLPAAVEFFFKSAHGKYRRAVEAAEADAGGRKMTCLLTDAFLFFGADMAEERGVPWVPLYIAGLASLSVHFHTDFIRQKLGLALPIHGHDDYDELEVDDKSLDFIPGLSAIRVKDLPGETVSNDLHSGLPLFLHKMGLSLPKATAIVVNSFQELNPIVATDLNSKLAKPILCLASVSDLTLSSSNPDIVDRACLPWLDQQKARTVAYISFGSTLCPSPDELVALVEALQVTDTPFLWSIKDNARKNLPQGFVETVTGKGKAKLVPWAPQMEVLKHPSVGVHVTHSGWNSVMESIAGGVPMICRPFFADNYMNARQVEHVWGIGVGVEGGIFTKSGLVTALQQVLLFGQGKKMRENIALLNELWRKADGPNGTSSQNYNALLDILTRRSNLSMH